MPEADTAEAARIRRRMQELMQLSRGGVLARNEMPYALLGQELVRLGAMQQLRRKYRPMTTSFNEALDAALAQAEGVLEGYVELGPILGPSEAEAKEFLAGWIGAVKALRACGCYWAYTCEEYEAKPLGSAENRPCGLCQALAAFVAAFPPDQEG